MSNPFVKPTNEYVDANLKRQYEERDAYYWHEILALITSQSISARDILRKYPAFNAYGIMSWGGARAFKQYF
jgi:hypothetical protein